MADKNDPFGMQQVQKGTDTQEQRSLQKSPGDPTDVPHAVQTQHPEGEPNENWTVEELKSYAKAKDVDIKGLSVKADLIQRLGGEQVDPLDEDDIEDDEPERAEQISDAQLPYTVVPDEESKGKDGRYPWMANIVKVRGRGRVAVALIPEGWVGDAELQVRLDEVELLRDLLTKVLAQTEDLRG